MKKIGGHHKLSHTVREDSRQAPLTEEEEEKEIIKMLVDRIPYPEISHRMHCNINHITEINKKLKESRKPVQKSIASLAFELYKKGKNSLDVAIELGLEAEEAEKYRLQFWRLCNLDELARIYSNYGPQLGQLIEIYKDFLDRGITLNKALEI